MSDEDYIATYCARFGFDYRISSQTVIIDGTKFDSIGDAFKSLKSISASNKLWLAWPDVAETSDVEELLPETHYHSLVLQPEVENVPQSALAVIQATDADNVVKLTLITPRRCITRSLRVDSASLYAVLMRGEYELAYSKNVLTISYVS